VAKRNDDPSKPGVQESPPERQHHRLAKGERVTGQSNPYGAEKGSTEDKLANGKSGNY
jgi:hypothetical protein